MKVFVMIYSTGIRISTGVNVKKLINKSRCDDWFIWNPTTCGCQCDKSSDVGEYLRKLQLQKKTYWKVSRKM